MARASRLLARRSTLGLLAVYLFGVGVARQVELYSGAPDAEGDKDCSLRADGLPAPVQDIVQVEEPPEWVEHRGGTINDASCLDRTRVYGVVRPTHADEIREAIVFAREEGIPVSVAGRRHSMGGQAFFPEALVLDMRGYNRMSVDEEAGVLRVQSGATWQEVLDQIHPLGYSVAAMQAIDILTVGGSVAVNAHGIDHRSGSMASSVRSMRIMLADGSVHEVSRTADPDLFHAAIGGYGLFGVILDVDLELTVNEMYRFDRRIIDIADFPGLFDDEIRPDDDYRLMYVHLSTDPSTFLEEAILYTYRAADRGGPIPPLRETGYVRGGRFVLNLAKTGSHGQRLKWFGQKHVLPLFRQCHVSRNEALREPEACLISRNEALNESLRVLDNKLPADTDILQEYFVPRRRLLSFLDSMRRILVDHEAVLLNASVRVVHPEEIALNYAPEEMFSVVLYLNQEVSPAGNEHMSRLTRRLIDAAAGHGGTFYLPYQLHYDRAQLVRAYPGIDGFFALKREYDPGLVFMNHWYDRYADDQAAETETASLEPGSPATVVWGEPLARDHPPPRWAASGPRAPPSGVLAHGAVA